MDAFKRLPENIKEKLLFLAKKLPESAQAEFLLKVSSRLGEVALEHPRTLFFAVAGWVLGEVIDNILTFNIPFTDTLVELTGDQASQLLLLGGAFYGFTRDHQKSSLRKTIRDIIEEEFVKIKSESVKSTVMMEC